MRAHRRQRDRGVTPPDAGGEWRLLGPAPDNSIGSPRPAVGAVPVDYYAANDRAAIGWDFSEYGNLASKVAAKVSMSLVRVPNYLTLGDSLDFNFDVAHEFGHALGLMLLAAIASLLPTCTCAQAQQPDITTRRLSPDEVRTLWTPLEK
jgi:hypothetical protein